MAIPLKSQLVGVEELEKQFNNLGKNFPKAKVRQAANKGCNIPLKEARKNAPKESGELKKGIVKKEEQKWKKQKHLKKAVFQVFFDNAKNSIFQKPISESGLGSRGGQTRIPHAYYPVSLEYGFHVDFGVRTQPLYFIKNAVEKTQVQALQTVIDELDKSIKKIINKK